MSANWVCTSTHSRIRTPLKKLARQASNVFLIDLSLRTPSNQAQSLSKPKNSDFSSVNCLCAWSACVAYSLGRSRGSCTDNADTITSISFKALLSAAAKIMRPSRGSVGRLANCEPSLVKFCVSLIAPSSCNKAYPSAMARGLGASINGKCSISASRSDFMRKITAARDERKISGSVNAGRRVKSSSSYSRTHTPAATRPQRPARWLAAAWLMGSTSSCSTLLR